LLAAALLLCLAAFPAWAQPLRIVATTFAQYDWTRQILGEDLQDAELTLLLDSRVDMHSYQPSAADIVAIAGCDLFIYIGGESDAWVQDVLAMIKNPGRIDVRLMDYAHPAADAHEHAHEHEEAAHHEHAQDEHVWLSLRHAMEMTQRIAQALCALRPERADQYMENAQAYTGKLSMLDEEYAKAIAGAAYDTVLFADRFPFAYLAADYGLKWAAAFSGCAAESEASFETILSLAGTADRLDLPAVLLIEGTKTQIVDTVIANTQKKNQEILRVNSLQSVTKADAASLNYLDVMRENLNVLKQALN